MRAEALALVAAKMRSALMIEGELSEEGLAALEGDHRDTFLELARRLVEPAAGDTAAAGAASGADARSLEALFAQAREAERTGDALLLDGEWEQLPTTPAEEVPLPGAVGDLWDQLFAPAAETAALTDAQLAGPAATPVRGAVLTFDQLTRAFARGARTRPRRPAPTGQLALFGADAA